MKPRLGRWTTHRSLPILNAHCPTLHNCLTQICSKWATWAMIQSEPFCSKEPQSSRPISFYCSVPIGTLYYLDSLDLYPSFFKFNANTISWFKVCNYNSSFGVHKDQFRGQRRARYQPFWATSFEKEDSHTYSYLNQRWIVDGRPYVPFQICDWFLRLG